MRQWPRACASVFCDHAAIAEAAANLLVRHGLTDFGYVGARYEEAAASDILPMLGGSRRSAEKRFRAATGKSILEEILDVRFEKLLPLLERGHLPLGTLAGLAGFSSENHLQRQFKARYGMTLSAWRKRHLG